MRSRILLIITTVLLFGVGIAVYAYNSTPTTTETFAAACCCCSGDSCPMKSADAKTASDAGKSCCCQGGAESCPMMKKGDAAMAVAKSADSKDTAATKTGCCCGDSCSMKKDAAGHKMTTGADHDAKTTGMESCPMMKDGKAASTDGKGCCSHSKEKNKETPAL